MKQLTNALLLAVSLCSLPLAAAPTLEQIKTGTKATVAGSLSAACLYVGTWVGTSCINTVYSLSKSKAKLAERKYMLGELAAGVVITSTLLYGSYYLAKKCAQQFGYFNETPAPDTTHDATKEKPKKQVRFDA